MKASIGRIHSRRAVIGGALASLASNGNAKAQHSSSADTRWRLLEAYPEFVRRADDESIIWRDGSRLPCFDGNPDKTFEEKLAHPSLEDQMSTPYVCGPKSVAPDVNDDPGRFRNLAFFKKMYGAGESDVRGDLVPVPWRIGRFSGDLPFTRVNGVDRIAARLVEELASLPSHCADFLIPPAGSFKWRLIDGTHRLSPHAFGIAVDINTRRADYWRWENSTRWRNAVPYEIVDVFERYGFIWGGKWYHFDTMHFEYRPELIVRDT